MNLAGFPEDHNKTITKSLRTLVNIVALLSRSKYTKRDNSRHVTDYIRYRFYSNGLRFSTRPLN